MARHSKAKKLFPAVAVIGEGITEHIYFNQLKQSLHGILVSASLYTNKPGI